MMDDEKLQLVAPDQLSWARTLAHRALQFATAAARANLEAEPDDSQSNFGWNSALKSFLSQPIPGSDGPYFVGLAISPLCLVIVADEKTIVTLDLEQLSIDSVQSWLDDQLQKLGLKPASQAKIPYTLPAESAAIEKFTLADASDALATLANWFDLAHAALATFVSEIGPLSPGPSPIRCWPHHFDLATYVGLQSGDAETAKGIGVGMSPGDEGYAQPYFYINPWPHLNVDDLPKAPSPSHWHTQGYVGVVVTAEALLAQGNVNDNLPTLIRSAFDIGHEQLGV